MFIEPTQVWKPTEYEAITLKPKVNWCVLAHWFGIQLDPTYMNHEWIFMLLAG